jgi:hypothetical protein
MANTEVKNFLDMVVNGHNGPFAPYLTDVSWSLDGSGIERTKQLKR